MGESTRPGDGKGAGDETEKGDGEAAASAPILGSSFSEPRRFNCAFKESLSKPN